MEPTSRMPDVTIVVVPRERFCVSLRSLESLYANTSGSFELIYVDGGSRKAIRDRLVAASREQGFELVRADRYLSPNQARNIGLDPPAAATWCSSTTTFASSPAGWMPW